MTTPEGKVKTWLNAALKNLSRTYKFMPVQMGFGAPGLDYYCCINGRFVAFETKVPGKNLTPRQEQTAQEILNAGGLVFVIRTKEDITGALRVIQYKCQL